MALLWIRDGAVKFLKGWREVGCLGSGALGTRPRMLVPRMSP